MQRKIIEAVDNKWLLRKPATRFWALKQKSPRNAEAPQRMRRRTQLHQPPRTEEGTRRSLGYQQHLQVKQAVKRSKDKIKIDEKELLAKTLYTIKGRNGMGPQGMEQKKRHR